MTLATWLRDLPTAAPSCSCVKTELLDEPPETLGFLDRVEILPLKIFDQRGRHRIDVGQCADQHRHLVQAGLLGRPPAAFAGDDLILLGMLRMRPRQQRLQDAPCTDGVDQFSEAVGAEAGARLERPGLQAIDRQSTDARRGVIARTLRNVSHERRKAPAEAGRRGHAAILDWRSSISAANWI